MHILLLAPATDLLPEGFLEGQRLAQAGKLLLLGSQPSAVQARGGGLLHGPRGRQPGERLRQDALRCGGASWGIRT